MALTIVCGASGSGKTASAVEALLQAMDGGRNAVFIAPTIPDARHFERRLLRIRPAIEAGSVTTFDGFFRQVRLAAGDNARILGEVERGLVLKSVADGLPATAFLKPSSQFDGFAGALGSLMDELTESGVSPEEFGARAKGIVSERLNSDLYRLYKGYSDALNEQGCIDVISARRRAVEALKNDPACLPPGSLVVLDGFCDFTDLERQAIETLAASGTEVLITLPYAPGLNSANAIRRHLDFFRGIDGAGMRQLPARNNPLRHADLVHLDAHLFEDRVTRVDATGGIRILKGVGLRGQADLVAAEILALYRSEKAGLDDIAVVCRSLGPDAAAIAAACHDFGIPYDFQGSLPLRDTPVGETALALLDFIRARMGADRPPPRQSLLRYLRSALPVVPQNMADEFARQVSAKGLETAEDLSRQWQHLHGRSLPAIDGLISAAGEGAAGLGESVLATMQGLVARELAAGARSASPLAGAEPDLLALKSLAAVCREAAALDGRNLPASDRVALLRNGIDAAAIQVRDGNRRGCVRILDPHRMQNQEFAAVFICGLLEKQFPSAPRQDAFLSDDVRSRLASRRGLALTIDDDQGHLEEERFLFHRTLSRARDVVYLCYPHCEVDGRATLPSLFVDEATAIFNELESEHQTMRTISDLAFDTAKAPTPGLALQSLGLLAGAHRSGKKGPSEAFYHSLMSVATASIGTGGIASGPGADLAGRLRRSLDAATSAAEYSLGEEAMAQFAGRDTFSASALEAYAVCPYKYFLGRVIQPSAMEDKTFFLERGQLAHCVLAKLGRSLKRAGVVLWRSGQEEIETAHELVDQFLDEAAGENGLDRDVDGMVLVTTLRHYLHRFVEQERVTPSGLEPSLFEFPFGGMDPDADCGGLQSAEEALLIGGGRFRVRGKIDRIDVVPGTNKALIIDYKSGGSASVPGWADYLEQGKLQIQLYMLAAREVMGLEPVGGEYFTLRDSSRRALYLEEEKDLLGKRPGKNDTLSRQELADALGQAEAAAVEIAGKVCAGRFAPGPLPGYECKKCDFTGICREAWR